MNWFTPSDITGSDGISPSTSEDQCEDLDIQFPPSMQNEKFVKDHATS